MRSGLARLAAEIKMRRTQHDGAFLVVEGKDDLRSWRPRSHESCRLVDKRGVCHVSADEGRMLRALTC